MKVLTSTGVVPLQYLSWGLFSTTSKASELPGLPACADGDKRSGDNISPD